MGVEGRIVASGFRYGNGIVVTPDSKIMYVSEIYINLGEKMSVSLVAAVSGYVMLIGSVFEKYILRCKL
jgi:hypothetical protein